MNTFERYKDPKESLGIGIWEINREFENCHDATLWFFNNYTSLFPGDDFKIYSEKLYLPMDVYYKMYNYLQHHVVIKAYYTTPHGDDHYRIIPDLLENMATEIYQRCERSQNRPFPIPVDK